MFIKKEKIDTKKYINSNDGVLKISEGVDLISDVLKLLDNGSNILIVLYDENKKDNPYTNGKNFKLILTLLERYLPTEIIKKRINFSNTDKNLYVYKYILNSF